MKASARWFAGTVVGALTFAAAPVAQADGIFVRCDFEVGTPFIYEQDGQQYVGAAFTAQNCATNLGSTPLVLEMDMSISNEQPDGTWAAHTNTYSTTQFVQDGSGFSVTFPNDGRLIPLKPGGYMTTGRATSNIEGLEHRTSARSAAIEEIARVDGRRITYPKPESNSARGPLRGGLENRCGHRPAMFAANWQECGSGLRLQHKQTHVRRRADPDRRPPEPRAPGNVELHAVDRRQAGQRRLL